MLATLILYTTLTCSHCIETKLVLKENCITYTNVLADKQSTPETIKYVPTLIINHKQMLVGSDEIDAYAIAHNACKE